MDAVRFAVLAAALLLLPGCDDPNRSGDEAVATPRSLAALVVQYVASPATAAYDARVPGKTSAKVEFAGTQAGEPPDSVLVTVEEIEPGEAETRKRICVGCDITDLDEHTVMHVTRGDRLPGAGYGETGYVRVSIFREREIVEVTYEGRPLRVDGQSADGLDVETLIALARDPGLGRTTVQGYVDEGNRLAAWTDSP